jgi:hypothetical protein
MSALIPCAICLIVPSSLLGSELLRSYQHVSYDIEGFIRGICDTALICETIWLESYKDIPQVLKASSNGCVATL